jgi:hypothetical protein
MTQMRRKKRARHIEGKRQKKKTFFLFQTSKGNKRLLELGAWLVGRKY